MILFLIPQFMENHLMREFKNQDILYFARLKFRSHGTLFGIKQADRLLHTYIIGKTGTGKTTLLKTKILQDIAQGRGACLLDPHG
jgi:type IV secretory pathway VirB4 component